MTPKIAPSRTRGQKGWNVTGTLGLLGCPMVIPRKKMNAANATTMGQGFVLQGENRQRHFPFSSRSDSLTRWGTLDCSQNGTFHLLLSWVSCQSRERVVVKGGTILESMPPKGWDLKVNLFAGWR